MLGSFGSAALYYGFAFLMVIWMVIKISRSSGLLAIATFFIWPLALVSLVRNWGDKDSDIRIPFFACLLALGMSFFMLSRGADRALIEGAAYFTEEDLALIQAGNPEAYEKIIEERERIVASGGSLEIDDYYYDDEDGYYDEDDYGVEDEAPAASPSAARSRPTTATAGVTSGAATTTTAVSVAPVEDPLLALPSAAAALSYRYASIDWPETAVSISLPPRFRFLPSQRLHRMAALRSQPLLPGTLGWITHESQDLAQPDAWVLEVRYLPVGHAPLGSEEVAFAGELGAMSGIKQRGPGGRRLGEGAFAPQWNANGRVLTWSLADKDGLFEHRAALPLRRGALSFVIRGLSPEQREMGLRMTRLMANRVQVPESEEWRPVARSGDPSSSVSLIRWVAGEALNGQPDGE